MRSVCVGGRVCVWEGRVCVGGESVCVGERVCVWEERVYVVG